MPTTEDLTILAALEGWIDAPPGTPRQDETTEMLSRLYIEVLGLIPYELAPVPPSAGAKARLMAAVRGEETQPAPAEPVQPERIAAPLPMPEPRPAAPRPAVPSVPAVRLARRWPLALAATLALALLGLSAWLYSQVGAQRTTIAGLRRQLSFERARSEGAFARVRQLENGSFVVGSRAVMVSTLRPVVPPGQPPLQPDAYGILFVAADHQHWYMSLQGLQPAPEGQVYKLWFMADRPVASGSFTARTGEPIDMSSQQMPAGTRGAMITLERDPDVPAPTGPAILQAPAPAAIS